MRYWPIIIAVILIATAFVWGVSATPAPVGVAASHAPVDVCPVVPNTPNFTLANGAVWLDGAEAPVGTIVTALSPRGNLVGCYEVSVASHYGAMYVYGEDTSANPPIPGMRDGETVSFRVNGLVAAVSPALVWHNDWATHPITLTAWTPTATPTATASPTPTHTPMPTYTPTQTPTPTSTSTPTPTYTPTPTPTYTPTPTSTSTPTIANQPDLIIKSIQVAPVSPAVGQALAVTVTLKNQGTAAAAGLIYTDVYADHSPAGCDDLGWAYGETNGLGPGDVAVLSFVHEGFSTAVVHYVRAFVDSSCQIVEVDETNNVSLVRVTVVSATTPTATPPPPVAPVVTVSRSGNNVVLTWPHSTRNTAYQVWRGTAPYFTPGATATLIGDGATGNCSNVGGTIACTDVGAVGNPDLNYYYLVRALNAAGGSADSNRVGEFDFALTPGN